MIDSFKGILRIEYLVKLIMEKDTAKSIDLSAEQIIEKAFNFHSQGNIYLKATKYYQLFISKDLKDFRVFSNYGVI